MNNKLKTIALAVAIKPLIPVLTFIHFYANENGERRMQATNGKLCVDMPTDFAIDVTVEADKFIRAMKLCKTRPTIKLTATQKLSVISGKFRALLNTTTDVFPVLTLATNKIKLPVASLLDACALLKPFISVDASRPWSQSILFRDGYVYATNNVIVARAKSNGIPNCAIPAFTVSTLLSIDKKPVDIIIKENYIGFHFEDSTWIRTSVFNTGWPNVESLIHPGGIEFFPAGFVDALADIAAFCDDAKLPVVYLNSSGVHTSLENEAGASIDVGSFAPAKFRLEIINLLATYAEGADFTNYPKPCYFKGYGGLEGAVIGVL